MISFHGFGSRLAVSESSSSFSQFTRVLPNSGPTVDVLVFRLTCPLAVEDDNWDAPSLSLGGMSSQHPDVRHWSRLQLPLGLDHGPPCLLFVMCSLPTRMSLWWAHQHHETLSFKPKRSVPSLLHYVEQGSWHIPNTETGTQPRSQSGPANFQVLPQEPPSAPPKHTPQTHPQKAPPKNLVGRDFLGFRTGFSRKFSGPI